MKILFFDTETTGVIKKGLKLKTDLDKFPRLVQLAWSLVDSKDRKEIKGRNKWIKPVGFTIPASKFHIENGITQEKADKLGMILRVELIEFNKAMAEADLLVAHNMQFDYLVMAGEMMRKKVPSLPKESRPKKICTMKPMTNICKIKGKYGFKFPSLQELHTFLFNEGFEDAHDADADMKAMQKCCFKLLDSKILTSKNLYDERSWKKHYS